MLSKNNIKLIKSLAEHKNRVKSGLFVAEGDKIVTELIASGLHVRHIYCTEKWPVSLIDSKQAYTVISEKELQRISQQKTPNQVLALAEIPTYEFSVADLGSDHGIVIDGIQDPGNLGTLIRICNWFGFSHLICSRNTADCYNSKVIQASMGAIFRVRVHYLNLENLIREYLDLTGNPVCGALLEGTPVQEFNFSQIGLIVLGNESRGISPEIRSLLTHQITIQSYPHGQRSMESLNVSVAGAIIMHELRRGSIRS